jgi:hypothetical protein
VDPERMPPVPDNAYRVGEPERLPPVPDNAYRVGEPERLPPVPDNAYRVGEPERMPPVPDNAYRVGEPERLPPVPDNAYRVGEPERLPPVPDNAYRVGDQERLPPVPDYAYRVGEPIIISDQAMHSAPINPENLITGLQLLKGVLDSSSESFKLAMTESASSLAVEATTTLGVIVGFAALLRYVNPYVAGFGALIGMQPVFADDVLADPALLLEVDFSKMDPPDKDILVGNLIESIALQNTLSQLIVKAKQLCEKENSKSCDQLLAFKL